MIPALTPEQRTQMETDGYFVLDHVFTPAEMNNIIQHIEAFQQRHEAALAAKGGTEGISRAGEISFTDHLAGRMMPSGNLLHV